MKIYVVRHGETDWNTAKRLQGRQDISLNSHGKQQAKNISEQLKDVQFDVCYVSPLQRTKQTADIILDHKRCRVIEAPLITEREFGQLEGKTLDEVRKILKGADSFDRRSNISTSGLEPINTMLTRAKQFLEQLLHEQPANATVLVVSHGAFLKAFHFAIIGYDDDTDFYSWHLENCQFGTYEI